MTQHREIFAALLAAALAGNSGAVLAQDTPKTPGALEEVVVTGTRITTNGNNEPTPVTVVTLAELSKFTPTSLGDAVVQLPALVSSTSRKQTGPGTTVGQVYLNLRGLGSTRNLVLLNGHRLVPTNSSGLFDVSLLPQQLVKRVEVVTGGASAAYGSDAVAGVTNFILDTTFTGIKGQVSHGVTKYHDDRTDRASIAAGGSFLQDRLHVVGSFDWLQSEGATGFAAGGPDRKWATDRHSLIINPNATPATPEDPRWIPAYDVRYPYATAGGMIPKGPLKGIQFLPDGSAAPFRYGSYLTNDFMVGGDGGSSAGTWALDVPIDSQSVFAHARFDVSDSLTLYAEAQYATTKTRADTGTVYSFKGSGLTIFRSNAYLPQSVRDKMDAAGVDSFPFWRVHHDFGTYHRHLEDGMKRGQIGAKGTFGGDWSWDAYYEFGRSYNDYYGGGGNLITENLYRALDAIVDPDDPTGQHIMCYSTYYSDPDNHCVPINLFGNGQPSAQALDYVTGTAWAKTIVHSKILGGQVSGTAATNWAGPVPVAFGFTHRNEEFVETSDPLSLVHKSSAGIRGFPPAYDGTQGMYQFGNVNPGSGSYSVNEVFGEVAVPLLRDKPAVQSLDLNAAVRLTDYSTIGKVNTWKVGLTYRPVDSLRLRATVSEDIRAPNLSDLYQSSPVGNLSVIDRITGTNHSSQAQILSPGNPNLEQEDAKTTTFGFVYSPTWLTGFNASVDYYDISIDNAIGSIRAQDIINLCAEGDSQMCSFISRTNGEITSIISTSLNIATLETNGIDVELNYGLPVAVGELSFRVLGNYTGKFTRATGAGTTRDSTATTPSRLNFMTNYQTDKFGFGIRERLIGETKISDFYTASDIADNHIDGYWYTDLNFSYSPDGQAGSLQLYLTVSNLFNKAPPTGIGPMIGAREASIYVGEYNRIGRYYTAGVRFNFQP